LRAGGLRRGLVVPPLLLLRVADACAFCCSALNCVKDSWRRRFGLVRAGCSAV
jgi:hypothetical protein